MQGQAFRVGELSGLLFEFAGIPGIVGLHNGLPPSDAFPIESLSIKLKSGGTIELSDPVEARLTPRYQTLMLQLQALNDTKYRNLVSHCHMGRHFNGMADLCLVPAESCLPSHRSPNTLKVERPQLIKPPPGSRSVLIQL